MTKLYEVELNSKGMPNFSTAKEVPQRIKGRWIKISPAGIYECSICGKNVMTSDIDAYDFCYGCGNPMEVIKCRK